MTKKFWCRTIVLQLFYSTYILAQHKGVIPKVENQESSVEFTSKNTYAVVVGISDYQDKNIQDLRFADKDAEEFAQWLQSAAGGRISSDKIQLLTNNKATNASIYLALNWLMEESKQGDQAIIYFSGHGDVETRTVKQNGFLLGYDTPAAVYMAGAVSLGYLQDVITTLSEKNKSKVLIITDACHAGKLAGSSIGGSQITGANLAKQFAGETKILSCQPNEFSIEGEQWGGGRGVFSFHLLDGLTGMADKNGDGLVNLNEIDRYLGDKVSPETAPQPQTPFTVGDRNTKISVIDASSLAQLYELKINQSNALAQISSKGLEDDLLAKSDSLTRIQYSAFKQSILSGKFLEPVDTCAWFYYQHLIRNSNLEPLHRLMRRNFAVALLDEVQKAINALMANDPEEALQWQWNPEKYTLYPDYLNLAMELLGSNHPLINSLKSKKLYFEAYTLSRLIGDQALSVFASDSIKNLAKNKLLDAIELESGAAYLYYSIGKLYEGSSQGILPITDINKSDSLILWCTKATELSPKWLLPYLNIFSEYLYVQLKKKEGMKWLEMATAIDTNNYTLKEFRVYADWYDGNFESAEKVAREMIVQRPEIELGHSLLGYTLLNAEKNINEADTHFKKVLQLDSSNFIWGYFPLGSILIAIKNYNKAKKHFLKGFELFNLTTGDKTASLSGLMYLAEISENFEEALYWSDSLLNYTIDLYHKIYSLTTKGHILFERGLYVEADSLLNHALTLDPTPNPCFIMDKAYLGLIAEKRGNISKAEDFFKQSEAYGYLIGSWRNLALYYFGEFLLRQNRKEEAKLKWEQIIKEFPRNCYGYYGMSLYYADQNNQNLALDMLEKSLDNRYPVPYPIFKEDVFKKMRKTKRFKAMMLKHFPPGWEKK